MSRLRRSALITSGVLLVGVFLAWLVLRAQPTMQPYVGMQTPLGWITHFAGVLVLIAGVALITRGIFGRSAVPVDEGGAVPVEERSAVAVDETN